MDEQPWFVILEDTTRFHVAEVEARRVQRAVEEFEAGAKPKEFFLTLLRDASRPLISVENVVSVGPVRPTDRVLPHPAPRRD